MPKSGYATTPATIKQENYINRLIKGADNFDNLNDSQRDIMKRMANAEVIDKSDASYLISGLLGCKEKPKGPMAEPGYYVKPSSGTYLVVVQNKRGDATYAKRLEVTKDKGQRARAKWVYAPGEARDVAHLTPMTLEEAAKFGHAHGVCFVCCRALTDPESVKNGIGPTCAKRFGKPQEAKPAVNVNGRAMKNHRR